MGFVLTSEDQHYLISFTITDLIDTIVQNVVSELKEMEDNNLVFDFSKIESFDSQSVILLNQLAESIKQKPLSVLGFGLNEEYLAQITFEITPTKTEAQDILFMEIVERELDF